MVFDAFDPSDHETVAFCVASARARSRAEAFGTIDTRSEIVRIVEQAVHVPGDGKAGGLAAASASKNSAQFRGLGLTIKVRKTDLMELGILV
jgi:hypothetical protein